MGTSDVTAECPIPQDRSCPSSVSLLKFGEG